MFKFQYKNTDICFSYWKTFMYILKNLNMWIYLFICKFYEI